MSLLAALPGAVLGGATQRQAELAAADGAIRAPLALSRRIAFVQLAGGAGASTTAAGVAALVAGRRASPVLAVNAAAGPRSLPWHLGLGVTEPTPPAAARRRPRSQAEALTGLPRTGSGAAVLDVHPGGDVAVTEGGWAEQVAPLARFCSVVVTDWGVRGAGADLGGVATASDVVCVVARADRAGLEHAVTAAAAVAALPHRPLALVAAVDVGRTGVRPLRQAVPVVRVPFEPARRAARPVDGAACSAATRTALIRLAAVVMGGGAR